MKDLKDIIVPLDRVRIAESIAKTLTSVQPMSESHGELFTDMLKYFDEAEMDDIIDELGDL